MVEAAVAAKLNAAVGIRVPPAMPPRTPRQEPVGPDASIHAPSSIYPLSKDEIERWRQEFEAHPEAGDALHDIVSVKKVRSARAVAKYTVWCVWAKYRTSAVLPHMLEALTHASVHVEYEGAAQ